MSAAIFSHSREGVLKIDADALATMRRHEQHAPTALEAGGLRLGRYLRDGHDLVVDFVTEPMPGDERSRFGFYRAAESHGRIVRESWDRSGGTCVLLGDWHTHAEPDPTPSDVDIDNWRSMLVESEPGEARFFVIVGQHVIRAWEGDTRTGAIRPMERR